MFSKASGICFRKTWSSAEVINSSVGIEVKLKKNRRVVFPLISGSSSKDSNLIWKSGKKEKLFSKASKTVWLYIRIYKHHFRVWFNPCKVCNQKITISPLDKETILPFPYIYVNIHTMKQNFTIYCHFFFFNLICEYCFQVAIITGGNGEAFFGIHRL